MRTRGRAAAGREKDTNNNNILLLYYNVYSAPRGETSFANTTLSGCNSVVRYEPL